MSMSRRLFLGRSAKLAGLGAGALLLPGCGTGDEAPPAAEPQPTEPDPANGGTPTAAPDPIEPISVTGAGAAAGFGFLMVNLGDYVDREGLTFELRTMSPTDSLVAAFSRQVDVANAAFLGTMRAYQENPDIRFLTPTFGGHTSVVTTPDGPDTLEDLAGMRLGTLARASNAYNDLSLILIEHGLDIENDFDLTLGDAGVLEGMFTQGELDAITPFEPIATRMLSSGVAKEIIQYNDEWIRLFDIGLPPASLAVHQAWIDDVGQDVVQAVIDASQRNVASFIGSTDRYFQHRDQWGLDDDDDIERLAQRMDPLFHPEMNDDVIAMYELYLELAKVGGVFEGEFAVADLVWTP